MDEKDKLYRLINSLSATEKGYIKKSFSCDAKDGAIYNDLFKLLLSKKTVSSVELGKRIPNLRYNKHYLYTLILSLLSDYYSNSITEISINKTLNHLEILYKKGLFKDFQSNLLKLKTTCYKHENFSVLLRVLKLERQFFNTQYYENFTSNELTENHNEYKSVLSKIENLNEYRFLSKKLYLIIKSKGSIRNEEDLKDLYEIIKNPLLTSEEMAISNDAKMSFYKSNAFFRIIRKEYEQAYYFNSKLMLLFQMNPLKIKNSLKDYLSVLANQLHLCMCTKRYKEYEKIFIEYSDLICSDINMNIRMKFRLLDIKLNYYLKSLQLKKAGELIESSKTFYENKNIISTSLFLNFTFNTVYFYILNGQPEKSLFYIHLILKESKGDSSTLYYTKLLHLLVHFELKNFTILETLVISTYKYLYKRNKIFKFENLVLKFIRSSFKAQNEKQMKELILEMIYQLKKLNEEPFQSSYKEIFDFQSWLESKTKNIDFIEVLKSADQKQKKTSARDVKIIKKDSIAG